MNEIYVGYDELSPGHNYPNLRDNLAGDVYPDKDRIIHYLLNGEEICTRMSYPKDIFTGKLFLVPCTIMCDEKYSWSTELTYYIDKYNLRLPKDFEEHILSHSK